jgi:hypothetical protein
MMVMASQRRTTVFPTSILLPVRKVRLLHKRSKILPARYARPNHRLVWLAWTNLPMDYVLIVTTVLQATADNEDADYFITPDTPLGFYAPASASDDSWPMVEVEMVSDYSVLGTLYTLMDSFGEKTDEMYGDDGNVTLRLQVEVSRVESLSEAVRDATNGKVEVRRVER